MNPNETTLAKQYITNVQLDLSVAAYTKVPTTWRSHNYTPDFNKLYFIMEGEGYLEVGGQRFSPCPGDLYLLPTGTVQSYGTVNQNTFGKYWCHFRAKIGHVDLFQFLSTSTFIHIQKPEWLKQKFEDLIYWHHQESLTSQMHLHSTFLEIIAFFMEQCETVKINSKTTDSLKRINNVLLYIEEHLSDKLSLTELAQVAHFHPNYLIRIFKNATGLSPIHYINRMRIEKAQQMLRFTNWNIMSISDSLGMDIAYFSRMFKEYTGFPPTEYRELFVEDNKPPLSVQARIDEDIFHTGTTSL
ncbi:AraC family transcriptional regulator [Alicyclobacillus fastidiosus]|uniref:AraC family transcriptional regulator n=1 Tax=Alicyclobacillus fastidiosus TaxID=392011 RepID=A0ABY6ZAD0_9BACL|nr:AraC family transcriptional regulator [Alicyclobacillus fastidiosus]WAH39840.1 AraC family transcriptional regulator [Alicyclobacillus fastidiosus]